MSLISFNNIVDDIIKALAQTFLLTVFLRLISTFFIREAHNVHSYKLGLSFRQPVHYIHLS